jgi:hypothetical protein
MKPVELGGSGTTPKDGSGLGSCPKADFGFSAFSTVSAAAVFVYVYTLCMYDY